MTSGIDHTFDILANTGNEAASTVLLAGLESPHRAIQEASLRALLARRSHAGQRELVARWHRLDDRWKKIVAEMPGRLSRAVRDAILGSDALHCANGCEAALYLREYDLMPALVNAIEDAANPHRDVAGKTLTGLAQLLYDELAGPRDYRERRDPQLLRKHVVGSLEKSVQRYDSHRRIEILEAFLMLAKRDNATLKKVLQNPHDKCYLPLVETLTTSNLLGVMRLALNFVDDPHAPSSAINIIAHRTDESFLAHLFKKIGFEPSAQAKSNLKRIDTIHWLKDDMQRLAEFDGPQQHAAVQMVMATRIGRLQKFAAVKFILREGKPAGRQAAATALAEFKGAEANDLVLQAVDDVDPHVQAAALRQLRDRGIPGAMTKLIEAVNNPHDVVREAAQSGLKELNFRRYLSTFDTLDDEVRQSTGLLVKKIDPETIPLLVKELAAPARSRRLRALQVAPVIKVVADAEPEIIRLLSDNDHFVRAEAARALADCRSSDAILALRQALLDNSIMVQEAAEETLQQLARAKKLASRSADTTPSAELPSGLNAVAEELMTKGTNAAAIENCRDTKPL